MKKTFPMIIKPYQGEGIRSPCSARPKAKLSWDMLTSADDPAKLVREAGSQWPSFHYVRLPEGIYCWWMLVSKTLRISQGRVVPTAAGAANPAGLSRAEGPKGGLHRDLRTLRQPHDLHRPRMPRSHGNPLWGRKFAERYPWKQWLTMLVCNGM